MHNTAQCAPLIKAHTMKAVKYTAPIYWTSYLMYGDDSGLEPAELATAQAWVKAIGLGEPVDVINDGHLARSYDHCDDAGVQLEICTYIFLKPRAVKTIAHQIRVNAQGYTGDGAYYGALRAGEKIYVVMRDGLSGEYRVPNRAAAIARFESLIRRRDDGTAYMGADWAV